MPLIERAIVADLLDRLRREPRLIQVLIGPRQVGKSVAAQQLCARWSGATRHAAADLPLPPGPEWVENQWQLARQDSLTSPALLVLDEVQKVRGWSEVVKRLWDEDRRSGKDLSVVILGSSALLLTHGATESLAGRFFLHRCSHWTWPEMHRAFGWDLDRWLYFGGYPGAAPFVAEPEAWRSYVVDSLIETILARDVLALQTVNKPALLRHLFVYAAAFPAQIVSYNKILGQLQDAGNTTTLAHYVRLLESAFLVSGLERHSPGMARSRGSSPKLILWNNALVTALGRSAFNETRSEGDRWGRLVENAVGAHLLNHLQGLRWEISYWRHRNDEVDFIVRSGDATWAIEVKSGRAAPATRGFESFRRISPDARTLLVGSGGVPLEEFFSREPRSLLE